MDQERKLVLAVVGAAHGVQGELKVKSYTEDPERFAQYGVLFDSEGNVFDVEHVRQINNALIVKFRGVNDRDQARQLTGRELFIARGQLPDELNDNEYYYDDLVGLNAFDLDDQHLGTVSAIHNFGAGDLLEVARLDGNTYFVPFSEAAVPSINMRARKLIIDPGAAGLNSEPEDEFAESDSEQ